MNSQQFPLLGGMILALLVIATACGGDTTPAALLDTVGGVSIRSESNSLFLTADSLQQGLVQRIALIDEVSQVDSYLELDTVPNGIVGVSPGSPLRLRGGPVNIVSGDGLFQEDEEAAIPGIGVNADSYGFGMTGSMMGHRFEVGQSFQLQGQRLRVTGEYAPVTP